MRDHYPAFVDKKVAIAVVGQGSPEDLQKFLADRKLPFDLYCDPPGDAYRAYGLERGSLWDVTLNPKVVARGVRAAREGFVTSGVKGDAFQLPGSFVIVEGSIRFLHRGESSSDITPPGDLLAAASEAA